MQGLTCCKPSDAKLYFFHIGMCYESSKNLPKAIAQYKRATELDTNYRYIVEALIGCVISTLSVDNVPCRDAAWRLALAIQKSGDSAALITSLTALCEAHPGDVRHKVALGNALLDLVCFVLFAELMGISDCLHTALVRFRRAK